MDKQRANQLNGTASAILAVGLVVAILISSIPGIVLVIASMAIFAYVYAQSRAES